MKYSISAAASVNMGRLRANNEDNLYFNGLFLTEQTREQPAEFEIVCGDNRQFYAVCDGMGGEQYGELASLLAVETIHKYAEYMKRETAAKTAELIESCIQEANNAICEAQRMQGSSRIGTTLALLVAEGKTADIYNVGDSRVYLLRDGKLKQLSEDHTSVMNAIKMGILRPEEAKTHPSRNKLTQYVGISPAEMVIVAHKNTVKIKKKDIFLLCSDGLSDMIDESEMQRILNETGRPDEAARQLMDAALYRGGKDNVTVIVVGIINA
jgi:protein phosphatase